MKTASKETNMLDGKKSMSELRVITDEKKMAADIAKRDTIVWGLRVPENMGAELATKYEMSPDAEVGRHIHELMVALFGVQMGTKKLTPVQAEQVMLIVLASVLYGVCEFGQQIDDKDIKSAVGYLSEDVEDLKTYLGETLNSTPKTLYDLSRIASGYTNGYTFSWPKTSSLEYFGNFLSAYYKPKGKEHIGSDRFFKDYGRVLYRHLTPGYDSRKSIWNIRHSETKVHDVCDLINAVKKMGNEYVIAPAVNLYALALDACLERSYEAHKAHWAYPRGKKTK